MDLERYYELRAILQQWRLRLAESIRGRIEDSARWLNRLQAMYEGEGVSEAFDEWLDRWCRQAAIQFILRILFLRVLEDRGLLGVVRIRNTDGQKMWAQLTRNLGAAHYVQWCCWDAAHLLPDLFGPTDYDLVLPHDDLAQRFLDDVWRRPDPNRPGWLRFDFRADPARDDQGFETRFIGDLYQELDPEIRKRYALLQTPHFISQFILEHTLLKRFEEKDFREVTLIDPTCGSGHFLVDAFWMFVKRYEEGASGQQSVVSRQPQDKSRLASNQRAKIARTIVEKHLFGCDINPYATALARFRLTLAACDYARLTSLGELRDLRFNLVTIDSLIPYEKLMVSGVRADSAAARVLGQPEAIERALPVLRKRYDVVVGNPPYITSRDKVKRDLYAEYYPLSARGKFHLSAPFTERFFVLATPSGKVGLINSNAFTKRDFGKALVIKYLPTQDIWAIVDTSGVDIPGHGTPTLILLGRKSDPRKESLTVVSCLRGEYTAVTGSEGGAIWQEIEHNFPDCPYVSDNIEIRNRSRKEFSKHPWNLQFAKANLISSMISSSEERLKDLAINDGVGISLFTLDDEVFIQRGDVFRRYRIPQSLTRPMVIGESIRDWIAVASTRVLFPYRVSDDDELETVDLADYPTLKRYLAPFRNHLASSHTATTKSTETGWYEFGRLTVEKYTVENRLGLPRVATHNHVCLDSSSSFGLLFKDSSAVIALKDDSLSHSVAVLGMLSSSATAFILKEWSYNKGAGPDPVRDRFDFAAQRLANLPIPRRYMSDTLVSLSQDTANLSDLLTANDSKLLFSLSGEAYCEDSSTVHQVVSQSDFPIHFTIARELRVARDRLIALRRDIRGRMIFLQEEMDWLAYGMYGLIKKVPLAEDYLSPSEYRAARLGLGIRPFEVAGKGYEGDWPVGYQPPPLPDYLRSLTEARMAIIESNPDIALLEDPLYKRRWVPPDYDKEFREAAQWWLAEKLEWALEQHGQPISLRRWARLLGQDERVNAVLEVLTGTPMFDLERELLKVIRANAVPNRPEHYLKPAGLRKFYDPEPTPQYKQAQFSDGTAWKNRGKLNIPRERFIGYAEFDHTRRGADTPENGGPWFGWAGWNAGQRADALAFLLDQANRAGWRLHWQQCGLRAALRDLLPQLDDLPAADRAEFEAIAAMCGISLESGCYCQAYCEAMVRGEPGVSGVTEEVLGVKVLPVGEGRREQGGKKKGKGEQIELGLGK